MYRWKARLLATRAGWAAYRRWGERRGTLDARRTAAEHLARFAPGASLADIGCMWGINGAHAFEAERLGASRVAAVDLYATDDFHRQHAQRNSKVELIIGGADDPAVGDAVGTVDVVWCWGVLYHHPSPHQLVANLAALSRRLLVIESVTAPEMSTPQAGVFLPYLPPSASRAWMPAGGAERKLGITHPFQREEGFTNNFWALTPSCISALLRTTGFRTLELSASPSGIGRHVFVAERQDC